MGREVLNLIESGLLPRAATYRTLSNLNITFSLSSLCRVGRGSIADMPSPPDEHDGRHIVVIAAAHARFAADVARKLGPRMRCVRLVSPGADARGAARTQADAVWLEYRVADPFDYAEVRAALSGATLAIWGSGEMKTRARLEVGAPADRAAFAADTFARACASAAASTLFVRRADEADATALVREITKRAEEPPRGRARKPIEHEHACADLHGGAPWESRRSTISSLQRMRLPAGLDARRACAEYMKWLPRATGMTFEVAAAGAGYVVTARGSRVPLLAFARDAQRSTSWCEHLAISGGLLAAPGQRGFFEFRESRGGASLWTLVHDFAPRLPWPLYRITQAPLHSAVMAAFAQHLEQL